ncbi:GNAT family N-acetyltransferase [Muriicola sp. Z0-33]|uniref:GNAT family N-acetyltransferase n=1 Tax=Muriicola sp. Z0-33 TaxID=2816957 RepID=UPI0022373887|nr:GNAT family N-acetyltransferase [Muriicola sp. Z0-33]MCW5516515.1 GNAT family N-acetyltransferase [Muriicola sp. Z0-33]
MLSLTGDKIKLRALEAEDLNFLYELENNPDIWEISGTITPYSKHVLKLYLENAYRDIYEVKQLRLCICTKDEETVGLIDLFDFDPKNRRAGIGIVVLEAEYRNQGIGREAIELVCKYAFTVLNIRQLYANVGEENSASLHLFKKIGFEIVGVKKDWILSGGNFKNEVLLQKINN